jgi:4-hydroxy-3-methylbut-2-enyl diphosphate reductase
MNEDLNNPVVEEELDANAPAPAEEPSLEPVEEAQADALIAQEGEQEQEQQPAQSNTEADRELTPEESFERDLEKSLVRIRPGQVKKGTVVQIVGDDVFVNIGYKADGVIPQSELSLDPKASAADIVSVGDEISVEIIKVNDGEGNVLLSKKAVDRRNADRQAISDLADGRPFEVTIRQAVKSGVLTEYRGARVFIPASQLADRYVENLDEFVNKKIMVKAIEVDKSRRRVVASHRQVLRDQIVAARKEKYNQFEPGQTVKGIIRRIADFGAFTDIGGVDGLIHVTDLSWGRIKHPSDVVKVGDEVEVQVLSVNADAERIALGYKQLQPKPWDHASERYLIGDIVEGTVDRIAPFGAFVELEPGLFGLVHISQVATRRIDKVEDELRVGDVITVKVMEVDPAAKRISLSRRAVLSQDRPPRTYQQDEGEEENSGNRYEIPPMEEAKVSLADFFPNEFKES